MKSLFKDLLVLLGVCIGLAMAMPAQAQTLGLMSLTTTTVATSTTTDVGGTAIDVATFPDLTVYCAAAATNASASAAVTFYFAGSPDGTNYTTVCDTNWTATATLAGASTVRVAKTFNLEGARYLKLLKVANADTNGYISSIAVYYYRRK